MNTLNEHPEIQFDKIGDWLVDVALGDFDLNALFLEFVGRIVAAGIPLQRAHLATRSLHPMFVAGTVTWDRDHEPDIARIVAEDDNSEGWMQSPLYALLQRGGFETRHRLVSGEDWRLFPILVDLRERGATDYFAQIVIFGPQQQAWARQDGCIFSWTTDAPGGFTNDQIASLRWLGNRFGVLAKLDRREQTTVNIVSAYLGTEAGKRVLDGQIKLGDGEMTASVHKRI